MTRRRVVFRAVLVLVIACAVGCSKERKAVNAIQEAFEAGNYEETLVQSEHALRRNVRIPSVYYFYGRALLELGRDYESVRRFEEAVAMDSSFAPQIAAHLVEKGGQAGDRSGRLKAAVHFDRNVDLGPYKFLVASELFSERSYEEAALLYRAAVTEHPDTSAAERALFNLSECYLALADTAEAINMLEEELMRFPKGELSGQARYKLVNILYDNAQSEFFRGNYETVVEVVRSLLERTTNRTLLQRARFLLGEAYERLEDYPSAYLQYKTIIDEDRGASGRIVDRARSKIAALQDAGLL